jgi:CBS domain-containing protein
MDTLAKDIMSTKLVVVHSDTSIEEAVKLLVNNKITGLPVVDDDGRMVGILSEYDVICAVANAKNAANSSESLRRPVEYTKQLISVKESESLTVILTKFIDQKVRRLPVLDQQEHLVGMITRRDIMRVLYYRAKVGE